MTKYYDPTLPKVTDKFNSFVQKKVVPARADLTNDGLSYVQHHDGSGPRWNVLYALKDVRPASVDELMGHELCRGMSRNRIVSELNELEGEGKVQKL